MGNPWLITMENLTPPFLSTSRSPSGRRSPLASKRKILQTSSGSLPWGPGLLGAPFGEHILRGHGEDAEVFQRSWPTCFSKNVGSMGILFWDTSPWVSHPAWSAAAPTSWPRLEWPTMGWSWFWFKPQTNQPKQSLQNQSTGKLQQKSSRVLGETNSAPYWGLQRIQLRGTAGRFLQVKAFKKSWVRVRMENGARNLHNYGARKLSKWLDLVSHISWIVFNIKKNRSSDLVSFQTQVGTAQLTRNQPPMLAKSDVARQPLQKTSSAPSEHRNAWDLWMVIPPKKWYSCQKLIYSHLRNT